MLLFFTFIVLVALDTFGRFTALMTFLSDQLRNWNLLALLSAALDFEAKLLVIMLAVVLDGLADVQLSRVESYSKLLFGLVNFEIGAFTFGFLDFWGCFLFVRGVILIAVMKLYESWRLTFAFRMLLTRLDHIRTRLNLWKNWRLDWLLIQWWRTYTLKLLGKIPKIAAFHDHFDVLSFCFSWFICVSNTQSYKMSNIFHLKIDVKFALFELFL